jgi:hypothetical protein
MTYWLPIQFQFGSTIRCRFTYFTETEVKFSSGFFQFQSGSTISTGLSPISLVSHRDYDIAIPQFNPSVLFISEC